MPYIHFQKNSTATTTTTSITAITTTSTTTTSTTTTKLVVYMSDSLGKFYFPSSLSYLS